MVLKTFQSQTVPLARWEDGSIRVGNTRVLLDLLAYAFNEGRTPEEIVMNYPTLKLSEVYGVITYYLENRDEVDAYIFGREQEASKLWEKIKSDPNQKLIREKLLSKRTTKPKD